MSKTTFLFYMTFVMSLFLTISCSNDSKEQESSFILKSNIKENEKVQLGQYVVFGVELNGRDITADTGVKYFVNEKEVEGNRYETTETGIVTAMALYKGQKSNTIKIEVEEAEESELLLLYDKQDETLALGDEITFKVILKENESERDVTSESKLFVDNQLLDGVKYKADKKGMISVLAEYGDKKTEHHQFFVVDENTDANIDASGLKVVRDYVSAERDPLENEFSSVRVNVLGYAGGKDDPKEINVYKYQIEGKEIECSRWNIELVTDRPGHQASFSLFVPVEGDKVLNPKQSDKVYVASLNIDLPGKSNEHESLTLSGWDKHDVKVLSAMTFSFKELSLRKKESNFLFDVYLKFGAHIQATIRDNYTGEDLDVKISFVCNKEEDNTPDVFRIQNDQMDVARVIKINRIEDLF